jgi:2-beta-glucuronyltransferase
MKKIVLLSGHYYGSKRKAGFHFLAEAFDSLGYEVVFVTAVFSIISILRMDYKIFEKYFIRNILKSLNFNKIKSLVNITPIHPLNRRSRFLDLLIKKGYFLKSRIKKEIVSADYIIFESVPSILFFSEIKKINPFAKLIYRMSDDMEAIRYSSNIIQYERSILKEFDLISIPTRVMYEKFKSLSPDNINLQFHGINKTDYDNSNNSPYKEKINHIFVGNSHLDNNFLEIASKKFRDHIFHIIGPFEKKVFESNVKYYGQMSFKETIPFVKFATTGLQIRSNETEVTATLSDSLKILQYCYCGLPIIAPSIIEAKHRKNIFYYEYGNQESIEKSIIKALNFTDKEFKDYINSWEDVVKSLL